MELLSGSSPAVKSVIEKTLKEWEKNDEIVILSTIPDTLVNSMFQAIIAVAPNPTQDSLNQAELKVTLELNNSELNLFRSALRELTL